MKRIVVSPGRCIGCGVCEVVCSLRFEKGIHPNKSRIKVVKIADRGIDMPVVCLQCTDAPCGEACPTAAIQRTKPEEPITVDSEKCTFCGLCVQACPIGAIELDGDQRVAIVCDLCDMNPMCASHCPTQAIEFIELADVSFHERIRDGIASEGKTPAQKRERFAHLRGRPGKFPDPFNHPNYLYRHKIVQTRYENSSSTKK